MPDEPEFRGVPLPASLVLSQAPAFSIHDENGLQLDLHRNFDPQVDPIVYVPVTESIALLKWGEQYAEALTSDEAIPLTDRLLFIHRGLAMEADRLYRYSARFARLDALTGAIEVAGAFLVREPSTYAMVFSMTPPSYNAIAHAAGTAVLTAALYAGVLTNDGDAVDSEALGSALLTGMSADLGLVNSHRDLLSFDRTMTPPERNILRAHPMSSDRILQRIGIQKQEVLDAVTYHHERADGSGYPLGLAQIALPRLAQCVGLADTFLGLITDRPGRPAITPVSALGSVATGEFTRQVVATLAQLVANEANARPPVAAA